MTCLREKSNQEGDKKIMKVKLSYVPWRVRLFPEYAAVKSDDGRLEFPDCGNTELPFPQKIHDGIQKWKRFPVAYGATPETSQDVFCLLDRIPTPFSLLDPALSQVAKAEKIKPSELPAELRGLYERLVAIGRAQANPDTEGGEA
jgi:hypothetical protein